MPDVIQIETPLKTSLKKDAQENPKIPSKPKENTKQIPGSPLTGTLIDLTKLDHQTAMEIMDILNLSKISPKSSIDGSQEPHKKLALEITASEREKVYKKLGTTPDGKPVTSAYLLTPSQRQALEYMKQIRALTPDTKEVKRASLPASVKFHGDISKFDEFWNAVEGHYRQQQASYLFDNNFVEMFAKYGADCYINVSGITSANQIIRDVEALYGAIQTSCQKGVAKSILMKHQRDSNGVAAWQDMIEEFGSDGDKESRLDSLEKLVNTPFSKSYKGGLEAWVRDYENAFAEMELLGETSYSQDVTKKRKIIQNCVSRDSKDAMMLRELCKNKSFKETCKMLRTHAIASHSTNSRRVNNTARDRLVQLLTKQLNSQEEQYQTPDISPLDDTGNLEASANLARVSPQIWRELPKEIQDLINKARQDKNKKRELEKGNSKTSTDLPKQYTKANLAQQEDVEDIVDEFLSEALMDENEDTEDLNIFNAMLSQVVHVSVTEEQVSTCMNSLTIEQNEKMVILDNGADTCVVGKGWTNIAVHPSRKAHVIGFDHKVAVKRNLDIVTACTVVDVEGETFLLQVNEAVSNPSSEHTLLSEYQVRDFGVKVNSIAKKHGGIKTSLLMVTKFLVVSITVSFILSAEPQLRKNWINLIQ